MEQVSLLSLWLPTLLSAVIVFLAAMIAWTVLPHHRSDWVRVPNDEPLLQTIRDLSLQPGQYIFPAAMTPEGAKEADAKAKLEEGPIGSLIIRAGPPKMRKNLLFYFLFTLGVSFMVAYVGYATIGPGAEYRHVFRVLGTTAILAYSAAELPHAIWFGQTWGSSWKNVIDGLVFGLLTGGVFGWLWPGV
jgi:hypothetical protein